VPIPAATGAVLQRWGAAKPLQGIGAFREADAEHPRPEHPKSPARRNFIPSFSLPTSGITGIALSAPEGEAGCTFRRAGRAAKFGDRAPPRGNNLSPHSPEAFMGWLVSPSTILHPTSYLLPH